MTRSLFRRLRTLRHCTRGGTALEFALLSPVFFAFLFTILEGGRLLWVKQTLNEVAYSAVRCMSVSSTCTTNATVQSYAVARAARYNIKVTTANVVPVQGTVSTNCDGITNANKVTITAAFNSPTRKIIPRMPTSVSTHACFTKLS